MSSDGSRGGRVLIHLVNSGGLILPVNRRIRLGRIRRAIGAVVPGSRPLGDVARPSLGSELGMVLGTGVAVAQ